MRLTKIFTEHMSDWAQQRVTGGFSGLTYPSRSPISGFIDNPPEMSRSGDNHMRAPRAPRQKPEPPRYWPGDRSRRADRVQDIYMSLHHDLQVAILCRWVGMEGHGVDEAMALRVCGVSRSAYYDRLDRAHREIADRLQIRAVA